MVKKKLIRFAENYTFDHLFQQSYEELMKGFPLKGKWHSEYFGNHNPITLELGCGKGEYTVGLARMSPKKNFIGVDIKGARLWKGGKAVQRDNMKNVAFIRTKIELIEHFFDPDEVDEIWITFPDPQPKRERRRLTSPLFLSRYAGVIKDGGIVHLKTDNKDFFEYSLEIIENSGHELLMADHDIYSSGFKGPATEIQTFYEEMFKKEDSPIKYLQFKFRQIG